ncbi:UDP-glucose--hexose-1-phosphate uridylyltransferase [Streptococcus minor]|uniref:Galactose-1-phosphate uridylyltransferase n=1 Tax=Streptococcus minor TaxID=229549 RepID=A0A3P1VAS2_9STRE|nr:UDP-glucose--hexose-1-phosphate uridylyltransferase [Streptococcus minor]RRD31332.1 UDP-glucose--hexose-1-phosphate uridylyltransferase [Streptococcus minor]
MLETLLTSFISRVIADTEYEEMDRTYLSNRVMALVGEEGLDAETSATNLIDLKDELVALAVKNGFCGELLEEQDIIGAQLMDLITPAPSQVNKAFWKTYAVDPKQAIADFYHLSQANDYIKNKAIAKNIYYQTPTEYGDLEITINLSKPEKDPKAIAAAKLAKSSSYPKCQLCMENEGYQGRINHPARANHRVIRYEMEDQTWGFQYSPYAYFNEHCIFFYGQHEPMKISRLTFERLLNIVDLFPGYFAGSNADLPIVGGSILTHEHYQGGRHTFAMEKAPIERSFTISGFEDIQAGLLKWPMSVIRISGPDKSRLVDLADKILLDWQEYSDAEVGILASSNGELHHTITPIARKKDDLFELDLVLRDNQTSEEFPDGVYHPHPDVQHIKKENIGLIEVMGLAILPPRLKDELQIVEDFLLGKVEKVADYHQEWANQLKIDYSISPDNVSQVVQEAVGKVFSRVLEDAGVYKRTPQGQAAFLRFVESLG